MPINLRPEYVVIAALSLVGVVVTWLAAVNGPGLTPDPVSYIRIARQLAAGVSVLEIGTHWPPGYPVFLYWLDVLPGTEFGAARVLAVVAVTGSLIPAGLILARELRGPHAVYPQAAALLLLPDQPGCSFPKKSSSSGR